MRNRFGLIFFSFATMWSIAMGAYYYIMNEWIFVCLNVTPLPIYIYSLIQEIREEIEVFKLNKQFKKQS